MVAVDAPPGDVLMSLLAPGGSRPEGYVTCTSPREDRRWQRACGAGWRIIPASWNRLFPVKSWELLEVVPALTIGCELQGLGNRAAGRGQNQLVGSG